MSVFRVMTICICMVMSGCTGAAEEEASSPTSTTTGTTTTVTGTTGTTTTVTSTTKTTETTATTETDPFPLLPALPLRTQGRFIVDDTGYRFKLASVNWYGFEELDYVPAGLEIAHIDDTAAIIAEMGFNSVRLPFSLEMVTLNPVVSDKVVAANPELFGKRALDVMDAIIDALARHGVVTILDNHSSEAVWYSLTHGLWYTNDYPESVWISVWVELATRYQDHPAVVGYDLRNELRGGATWGGPAATDWKAAASRAADAIFAVDTKPLIVVEGVNYAADLTGPYYDPLVLSVPNRLVYSSHDYSWFHAQIYSYDQLAYDLGSTWGFIIAEDQPFTAPVWVGEFGTCNTSLACIEGSSYEGAWFSTFLQYLDAGDYDWAYWPVNGTMARADDREYGAVDWFGVLDETWSEPALPELLEALQAIQDPWVGPEYHTND
jgi:endoglucanase